MYLPHSLMHYGLKAVSKRRYKSIYILANMEAQYHTLQIGYNRFFIDVRWLIFKFLFSL